LVKRSRSLALKLFSASRLMSKRLYAGLLRRDSLATNDAQPARAAKLFAVLLPSRPKSDAE
jgi:hypothetical protein